MKMNELVQKSKEELITLLQEKRRRADEVVFLLHSKKVKNVKELSQIKKDIARIMTKLQSYE